MNTKLAFSQIHTPCADCVFCKNEIQDGKKIQTGCKLNKIEQYEAAGVDVENCYDENENEFKVINGRFCMFYRNNEIMEQYPPDSWEEIVAAQTKVPYQLIIFIEPEMTMRQVKDSINNIKAQKSQPSMVTFVNYSYNNYMKDMDNPQRIKPVELLELLQASEFHLFSLKNMYEDTPDYRTAIDFVMDSTNKYPYPFYACFQAGFPIPKSFSEDLNNAIFIKMLQIGFAKPVDEINGMIVNKTAHKKHGGNSFFIELEKKLAKYEENFEKFMYEATDRDWETKPI